MPSSDDATRKLRSGSREPLLRVEGLCTYFAVKKGFWRRTVGHVRAVDGVDLRLLRGQTLAIVGEAGAGKTTLARTLAGSCKASAGKALLEGKDILGSKGVDARELSRQIQIVAPETLAVPEPLNALRALTELGARLLIFDEPFSALTDSVRLRLFEHVRHRQDEQGLTCLLLTRDLELARALSDEVAVMHAGQIVETGATPSLLGHPHHPYTQGLLARPSPAATADSESVGVERASGCRFRARCPQAFNRCADREPTLFAVPGGLSRCFLHDPDGSGR